MAQPRFVDWDGLVYYDGKVKDYIDDKLSSCIKSGGSITYSELPAPSFQNLNYIYTITDEFTSNEYFEKPGYVYKAGTKVQVVDKDATYWYVIFNEIVNSSSSTSDNTEIEKLSSKIDILDAKIDKKQNELIDGINFSTINGKSLLSGSDVTIEDVCNIDSLTTVELGSIPVGTSLKGLTFNQIIARLLFNTVDPEIIEPTMIVTADNTTAIAGSPLTVGVHITFDRGKIDPANGTSGYRSGKVIKYGVNGEYFSSEENTYTIQIRIDHVEPGVTVIPVSVEYAEGEQPLTNHGTPSAIHSALPAGIIEEVVTITGLTVPLVGTTSMGTTVNKMEPITITEDIENYQTLTGVFESTSEDGSLQTGYQLQTTAATTYTDAQIVELPSSVTLRGIQVWDPIASKFQWYRGSAEESLEAFIKGEIRIQTIDGIDFEYTTYTYNTYNGSQLMTVSNSFRFVIE